MLRDGPVLPTLVRLSAPNLVALCSSAIITIAETAYVGRIGIAALAGVTLVFPLIMLMQMMSAGAIGGTISGAISRALGAGDTPRAEALAFNAAVIGLTAGLGFAALMWIAGPALYRAIGGNGEALAEAVAYSNIAAFGILGVWVTNTLASIARGAGVMTSPAMVLLAAGVLQIAVGGALAFGMGPFPQLGVTGVALGQAIAFTLSALVMLALLCNANARLRLRLNPALLHLERVMDILRTGALAVLSPIQSIATIMVLTALVARFGADALAGYGVGARLEFLLIPVAFSIGVGSVPMVGVAIGAGNIARARQVAWTAGSLAAGVLGVIAVIVMIAPDLWGRIFVEEPHVLEVTRSYLRIASFGYPFFGLALCLYFAAQGAGKLAAPIMAQTLRLVLIICGGAAILSWSLPLWTVFALSACAMAAQGLTTLVAIRATSWAPTPR